MILKHARIGDTVTDIVIQDHTILSVGPTDANGRDLDGARIFPGLIDIHMHGCAGHDCIDGDLNTIATFQEQNGTTAFCPTLTTAALPKMAQAASQTTTGGADILGFHAEGPFLNPAYGGAMDRQFLLAPDLKAFADLPNIRIITLSPELDGGLDFIEHCPVPAFIGHTAASYDTAMQALNRGAVGLTHVFNAMAPFHHRNPGPIGAAIDANAYVQVISDGFHLHPSIGRTLYRLFGRDRMILISDSIAATGMPDGDYRFDKQIIHVRNRQAHLANGTICGSTATLYDCVRCAIDMGIPADDAFVMASATPAALLGEKRGRIVPGYRADFLVTDEKYNLLEVIRC